MSGYKRTTRPSGTLYWPLILIPIKSTHLNSLHTRGKRVVANPAKKTYDGHYALPPEALFKQRQYSNMGALMQVVNNGAHFANGITAMFIACGQDVANVAESSAGFTYAEITPNGDYYFSVTIPSLIVATYGGGTGLLHKTNV